MTVRMVAVHLILVESMSVLLLRRYRTGWEDGKFSVIAGHVEGQESPVTAILREAREEAGIGIEAVDLKFAHVMHRINSDGEVKLDLWFVCDRWKGVPYNAEPHKCDELGWFAPETLPPNLVAHVRTALTLVM